MGHAKVNHIDSDENEPEEYTYPLQKIKYWDTQGILLPYSI